MDKGVSYIPGEGEDPAGLEEGVIRQSAHMQKRDRYLVKRHRQQHAMEELRLPQAVQWWSCDDVAEWIKFVGFPQYSDNFLDNNVSGEALMLLEKDDLAAMRVSSVGDRVLILNAIRRVQKHLAKGSLPALEDLKIPMPRQTKYSVPSLVQQPLDSARSVSSSAWGTSTASTPRNLALERKSKKPLSSWQKPKRSRPKPVDLPTITSSREKEGAGWKKSAGAWSSAWGASVDGGGPGKRLSLVKDVHIPTDCSVTGKTSAATDEKMRSYRNRAAVAAFVVNIVLLLTKSSFWWKVFGVFPAMFALIMGLQSKAKMWMRAGIKGRVPLDGQWGFGKKYMMSVGSTKKPALDETTALIVDEYRRMEIVRKARTMNFIALFATLFGSTTILILAYLTQPILYPSVESPDCPLGDTGVRCSGAGACMTGISPVAAGTNCTTAQCHCKCNLDRVGDACQYFDVGMPSSIVFIVAFLMQSVVSLARSYLGKDAKSLAVGD